MKYIFWSALFFILCGFLFYLTFCYYPHFVQTLVQTQIGYSSDDDKLGRGTFGDMYGALNTFLSGLAFLGLLITIGVQIYLHNEEKRIDKEKEDKKDRDKLIYLEHIIIEGNKIALNYKEAAEKFKQELIEKPSEIPMFKVSYSLSLLSTITNKIDQEASFNIYRTFFTNSDIIKVFSTFDLITKSCEFIINDIESKEKYHSLRQQEFKNLFNEFFNKVYTFYTKDNFQQRISEIFVYYKNTDKSSLSEAYKSFILPLIEVFETPQIFNQIPEYKDFLKEAMTLKTKFGIIEKQNLDIIPYLDNFTKNITGYHSETIKIVKPLNSFNETDEKEKNNLTNMTIAEEVKINTTISHIKGLLRKGFDAAFIADTFELPIQYVEEIIQKIKESSN